jgi:hypothetical protein
MGGWQAELIHNAEEAVLSKGSKQLSRVVPLSITEQIVYHRHFKADAIDGDTKFDRMVYMLEHPASGFERSAIQAHLNRLELEALLPLIYGDEWEMNQIEIMRRYNLVVYHRDLIVYASRRWGKSSGAVQSAAVTMVVLDVERAMFAQKLAMSQQNVQGVRNEILAIPENERDFIVKVNNRNEFKIIGPSGVLHGVVARAANTDVSSKFTERGGWAPKSIKK